MQACKDKSKTPSAYTDGVTIKIKCKKHPHLVQFIYREQIGADGKALAAPITTTGGTYNLTTDPTKPNWNTDSAAKPDANYEAAGLHRSDADALTTMDQPSLRPPPGGTARTTLKPLRSATARSCARSTGLENKRVRRLPPTPST